MSKKIFYLIIIIGFFSACKNERKKQSFFISPEAGTRVRAGEEITVDVDFISDNLIDSVQYFIDSTLAEVRRDTLPSKFKTGNITLGNHLITVKYFSAGKSEDISSNITLLAAKAPVQYSYEIVNTYPHDTSSYVEGLEYHNGFFYESDGEYGASTLRKTDVTSGRVIRSITIPSQYFAEGITVIGDKIIQLTYKEGVGFEYDLDSFKQNRQFPYSAGLEGWGLYFDGNKILNTDGTNNIHFLDKNNYQKIGGLEVYDDEGPVPLLNELEVVDGKIYANVYDTEGKYRNQILIINPETGAVKASINLKGLNPEEKLHPGDADYILNGIAYDSKGKRLFVTGKKWPKLFEIKVINNKE